jgi:hypothetical protein
MSLPKRNPRLSTARERLESQISRSKLIVVLLGSSGSGLEERRDIARVLNARGVAALVPEDDFPPDVSPSVAERALLSDADVDLVFVSVQSWGSATEFGQFHAEPRIAPKLRVLVDPNHHPLHNPRDGYLMDLYLTHLAAYGHVYAVDRGRLVPVPSTKSLITVLAETTRQLKFFQPDLIK